MSVKQEWGVRIKVLIITALIASLGNVLATWKDVRDGVEGASIVMPWETLSVMVVMLVIVVVGCEVDDLLRKINIKLPTALYISLITLLLSIPNFSPVAGWIETNFAKIGTLPLCTPILAYAGISIGKDMGDFRKQGIGIVLTSLLAFAGTYIGSAVIAQILLKATGVI